MILNPRGLWDNLLVGARALRLLVGRAIVGAARRCPHYGRGLGTQLLALPPDEGIGCLPGEDCFGAEECDPTGMGRTWWRLSVGADGAHHLSRSAASRRTTGNSEGDRRSRGGADGSGGYGKSAGSSLLTTRWSLSGLFERGGSCPALSCSSQLLAPPTAIRAELVQASH